MPPKQLKEPRRVTFLVEESQYQKVRHAAFKLEMKVSEWIREAIRKGLRK